MPDARVGAAGFPELDPAGALERLEREVLHVLRLDEENPIAAWRARVDTLVAAAARLTAHRFDALHYEGPGTDLAIGLLRGSRWEAARFETIDGLEHMPNLPTEEVFTTPDPERTHGTVTSTSRWCSWTVRWCATSSSASRPAGRSRSPLRSSRAAPTPGERGEAGRARGGTDRRIGEVAHRLTTRSSTRTPQAESRGRPARACARARGTRHERDRPAVRLPFEFLREPGGYVARWDAAYLARTYPCRSSF